MSEDEKLGKLTRELVASAAQFRDMLAVDAPTPVLLRQLREMEQKLDAIDGMTGNQLLTDDSNVWTVLQSKMMRLLELANSLDQK